MAKVEIPDYPDNSKTTRLKNRDAGINAKIVQTEMPKYISPIIKGKIVQKKKTIFKQALERFFGEDIPDVKNYLIDEVVIPSIKDFFAGLGHSATDIMFYGNARPYNGYRGGYPSIRQSGNYGSYYSVKDRQDRPTNFRRPKRAFDDIIFETRADGDVVLQGMFEYLENYGQVNVSCLKELCGITPDAFTDNDWGWKNLDGSDIKRIPEGYIISFPPVISLKGR